MKEPGAPKNRQGGILRLPEKAEANFLRISPREGVSDTLPLVIAPGLGERANNFKKLAQELADRGHDTFALTPTKGMKREAFLKQEKERLFQLAKTQGFYRGNEALVSALWEGLPLTEVRRAIALIRFAEDMRAKGETRRLQIIGHSQGAAYGTIAAFMRPDLFECVITMNPSGQTGTERFGLSSPMFWNFIKEMVKTGDRKIIANAASYIATQGFFFKKGTAMREAAALAAFDALPLVEALATAQPPVRFMTMPSENDTLFPAQKVRAARLERQKRWGYKDIGYLEETKGRGHYGVVTHPHEFADTVHQMLIAETDV